MPGSGDSNADYDWIFLVPCLQSDFTLVFSIQTMNVGFCCGSRHRIISAKSKRQSGQKQDNSNIFPSIGLIWRRINRMHSKLQADGTE